ncbi:hypothetical protein RH08_05495 [Candidatus Liberibacter asiaticus]|uniref:DUF1640 domain-containing protein n=1 Tax=Candidatus Liberibacter asiaticus str. gxpsy TaxID=1174529 RepID=A0ABM5NHG4_LIBAS|nr:hypothetical protein [Candidatus Liberibacter asiaticus]AGH17502.1 hypothetical protein WSI_05725 [Candidatus Liberibacter asiaticus str. gxpsy]KAE9513886.1 hypothetical protein FXW25_05235 [Candidatus Liberibacter asiaticus]KIH95347.1 hypothetical protein RH08_05495 [Candidatus Liberibacter asiaticus]MCU7488323.1 hypothetical protein [Candidatus Liberibacter asiaticus]QMV55159.1 hypothetical protein HUE70_05465 [Candidatus Liberibacter asiaticus]
MEKTAVKQKVQRDSVEIRFTKLETALPYLATKADLADVRTELKQDIANVRTELKADIADVRTELACTKSELKDAINSQTKWFMGIIVSVLVSTIGILLKLSSH